MANLQNSKRQRKYIVKRFNQLINVLEIEHIALRKLFAKCSPLSLHHALNDFLKQSLFESNTESRHSELVNLMIMKDAFLNIHAIIMGWDYDPHIQLKYAIEDIFQDNEIEMMKLLDFLHKDAGENEYQICNIHYKVLGDFKTLLLDLHIERNKLVNYRKSAS